MQPTPTPEQQGLMDAVERFCRERITPERLAAWAEQPRGIDADCWRAIAALGWLGLGLPEESGGSGLGLVEVACVLQECARGLIPRSVIGAIRGAWALARLDPGATELAALGRGERVATIALDERSCRDPRRFSTTARSGPSGIRIRGVKCYVPDGAHADYHVVAARDGAAISLFLVESQAAQATPVRTFDGGEQAVVRYADAPAVRRLGHGAALRRMRDEQVALALAEMLGGMRAALDMTVAYVKEREQFGQRIAVFQAVQHQVADMAISFTAARHLAWQAISRMAFGTVQGAELAMAAAFTGQAFKRITIAAHHLHGGAGYVVEHPLHYHAERAQALCIRYTPEASALEEVAADLLG
jgi:alkylation response protein AidB-like acyl-CoA dehydrogenase